MRSTKFWALLIGGMLIACALLSLLVLWATLPSSTAYVYQDGQLLRTIDLSQVDQPWTFTVEGPAGNNTIQVEPGRLRVAHADCPDQVCVHQGWISNGVVPIVCLPNQLVIQIQDGAEKPDLDGVTG